MPKPLKNASGKPPTPPKPRRSSDPNKAAHHQLIEHMARVTGDAADQPIVDPLTIIKEHMAKIGAKGGKIGGKRRLVTMTEAQRRKVAKKAADARWEKTRSKRPQK
jgi:hypothetical protein